LHSKQLRQIEADNDQPEREIAMKVNALDHVNIITADLEGTACFYAEVFNLDRRNAPAPLTPQTAQWMFDDAGRAIIHINSLDCARTYQRDVMAGPTGSIHHIALNCSGYDDVMERLQARAMECQINLVTAIGLRQVFTMDPNGVLLELNFFGD
jgi:4-hydroxyphenylpyruvate dioxygenase-like putative hemolysin